MNENVQNFWDKIKEVYARMELRQRVMIAILMAVTFGIIIYMISWGTSSGKEYGLLFAELNPSDAQVVIDKLKERNIPYKVRDQGTRIDIPVQGLYETRIFLASESIGKAHSGVGFEIFDKTSLGQTEFVQRNVNYVRALQGELERTILGITGVENVRVHLVLPGERVFREDQQQPSASVMLRLSVPLNRRQIDGIANFIASAVEGLSPANVKIIDQDSRVLQQEQKEEELFAELTKYQMDLQRERERLLTSRVEEVLERMVGRENFTAIVSVELNFDQVETTSERFDPEGQVVRSEEIQTNNLTNLSDSLAQINEHSITNYEISTTQQRRVNQVGDIKRLSVAVSINYRRTRPTSEEGVEIKYVPRTAEEIAQFENYIRSAVGYNPERGDQVAVVSMQFERDEIDELRDEQARNERFRQYTQLAEKGAVFVVLLVLIFVLTSQFKKIFEEPEPEPEEEEELEEELRPAFAEGGADEGFYPEGEEGMPMGDGKISFTFKPMRDIEIEQTEAMLLQETIQKFVIENPEVTVKLIKSWLMDERIPGTKKHG